MKTFKQVLTEHPRLNAFGYGQYRGFITQLEAADYERRQRLKLEQSARRVIEIAEWVAANLRSQRKVNTHHTSYGLKHVVERATGQYVANGEFIAAALMVGLKHKISENSPNVQFAITEDSIRSVDPRRRREGRRTVG